MSLYVTFVGHCFIPDREADIVGVEGVGREADKQTVSFCYEVAW